MQQHLLFISKQDVKQNLRVKNYLVNIIYYRVFHIYQFKKLRYRRYFVCFFRDGYFTKCDLIFSDKCTHHMIRHMFGIAAAAYGFSVNGYYRALFTFNIKPI